MITSIFQGDIKDSSKQLIFILTQIYCDTKTAADLCIGGLGNYGSRKDSKQDDCWIAEQEVPHILKMDKEKQAVLAQGKNLLFVFFYPEAQHMAPLPMIKRMVTTYQRVQHQLGLSENLICKILLVVCDHDGQHIVEALFDYDAENRSHGQSNTIREGAGITLR